MNKRLTIARYPPTVFACRRIEKKPQTLERVGTVVPSKEEQGGKRLARV
jgi:hypothetical protein